MTDTNTQISDDFRFINEIYRKSVHLSVLLIPLTYHWLKFDLWVIQMTLVGILLILIPIEIYRLKFNPSTWINNLTRQAEKTEPANYVLTTTGWVIVMLGANLFYPIEIAELAIVSTHLGDSAAALIGRGIGKRKLPFTERKTIEGYIAGVVGTYLIGFIFLILIGNPSFFLPLLPTLVLGIFDFFEDLPYWAADNIFHPILTVFLAFFMGIFGFNLYT